LQFSEHEMRKFLTSTYFEKNTMIDKYNIFDCGNNNPDNCPKYNPKFWNISLYVNSYNIKILTFHTLKILNYLQNYTYYAKMRMEIIFTPYLLFKLS
jgi:hypothetical protein